MIEETLTSRFLPFPVKPKHQEVMRPVPCRQVCSVRFMYEQLEHAPEVNDTPQVFWFQKI